MTTGLSAEELAGMTAEERAEWDALEADTTDEALKELAGDDDDAETDRHHADEGRLLDDVHEYPRLEEIGDHEREDRQHDDEWKPPEPLTPPVSIQVVHVSHEPAPVKPSVPTPPMDSEGQ